MVQQVQTHLKLLPDLVGTCNGHLLLGETHHLVELVRVDNYMGLLILMLVLEFNQFKLITELSSETFYKLHLCLLIISMITGF